MSSFRSICDPQIRFDLRRNRKRQQYDFPGKIRYKFARKNCYWQRRWDVASRFPFSLEVQFFAVADRFMFLFVELLCPVAIVTLCVLLWLPSDEPNLLKNCRWL